MKPQTQAPANACDCHVHIYDAAAPVTQPGMRAPANASAEDYRKVQSLNGTTRTVVVQPAVYRTDNRVTVEAIAKLGNARGIAVLHPDVTEEHLRELHAAGIRGVRFTQHDPKTAVTTPDMIEPLTRRIQAQGWHAQIHMLGDQLVRMASLIEGLPGTIVIDHMGRAPQPGGVNHPAVSLVRRWLEEGRAWVKLSGAYLNTAVGAPGYGDAGEIARTYVRAAPERCVWGSDWPHPTEREKPDDALLFGLLADWAGSRANLERILVDNPARLYGF